MQIRIPLKTIALLLLAATLTLGTVYYPRAAAQNDELDVFDPIVTVTLVDFDNGSGPIWSGKMTFVPRYCEKWRVPDTEYEFYEVFEVLWIPPNKVNVWVMDDTEDDIECAPLDSES